MSMSNHLQCGSLSSDGQRTVPETAPLSSSSHARKSTLALTPIHAKSSKESVRDWRQSPAWKRQQDETFGKIQDEIDTFHYTFPDLEVLLDDYPSELKEVEDSLRDTENGDDTKEDLETTRQQLESLISYMYNTRRFGYRRSVQKLVAQSDKILDQLLHLHGERNPNNEQEVIVCNKEEKAHETGSASESGSEAESEGEDDFLIPRLVDARKTAERIQILCDMADDRNLQVSADYLKTLTDLVESIAGPSTGADLKKGLSRVWQQVSSCFSDRLRGALISKQRADAFLASLKTSKLAFLEEAQRTATDAELPLIGERAKPYVEFESFLRNTWGIPREGSSADVNQFLSQLSIRGH